MTEIPYLPKPASKQNGLKIILAVTVLATLGLGYMAISPYFGPSAKEADPEKLSLPKYNLSAWESLPVQNDGRIKPLQTAAIEALRNITGRSKFQGHTALAVLLSWRFGNGTEPGCIDWEKTPFILCEDLDLRKAIFKGSSDPNIQSRIEDKFVSPYELRTSAGLQEILLSIERKKSQYMQNVEGASSKMSHYYDPIERKTQTVLQRLSMYETMISTLSRLDDRHDTINFLPLDKAQEAPWFSYGDLKLLLSGNNENQTQAHWVQMLKQRIGIVPQWYLTQEQMASLEEFKQALKNSKIDGVLEKLQESLKAQRLDSMMGKLYQDISKMSEDEFKTQAKKLNFPPEVTRDKFLKDYPGFADKTATDSSLKEIDKFRSQLPKSFSRIDVDSPENRMISMSYLELRYPQLHTDILKSQPCPFAEVKKGMESYQALSAAYRKDASAFATASSNFFGVIKECGKFVKEGYPGTDTIDLELLYNRSSPFLWGWVSMLAAVTLFLLAMGSGSKWLYLAGFVPFAISMGCQFFAFYCRISITGRPPVSNIFETLIYVGSMAAIFAVIFECIYKSRVIILSGAIVSMLALIMADQLPMSNGFDSKLSPLVPVLRSNYWLIVHVMTIVASYAAGALAWVIGNIALVMFYFNKEKADQVKSMALFAYRAIQVGVFLLAVGTLLGGIWAAESWGRFWGWDPKETWALIALIIYVIPLHARYVGWVKDFGMLVSAVVCFSAIVMSWYGANFVFGSGLHSYGAGDGGPWMMFFLGALNLVWVELVILKRTAMTTK